mgnify:CR=1 FL=1
MTSFGERTNVSVVIPCRNEESRITSLLDALMTQSPGPGPMEIVVADGMSDDGTRSRLGEYASSRPKWRLRVVDNLHRTIPAGLNVALRAATGNVIVRLDAHSSPAPDYIERCLTILEETHAANVGGVWDIEPGAETWVARSIAAAAADPLGAGDARYRTGGAAGPVDTVPFGAFRREWLERVGGYDESLQTNEDYELNWRIRKAGGVVWFDPSIRCKYYARARLRDLARQYARYGFWKARMVLRHTGSLRWRQFLPAGFVSASLLLLAFAAFAAWAWPVLLAGWVLYALVLLSRGIVLAFRWHEAALAAGVPVALAVMHLCWGGAFLTGAVTGLLRGFRVF